MLAGLARAGLALRLGLLARRLGLELAARGVGAVRGGEDDQVGRAGLGREAPRAGAGLAVAVAAGDERRVLEGRNLLAGALGGVRLFGGGLVGRRLLVVAALLVVRGLGDGCGLADRPGVALAGGQALDVQLDLVAAAAVEQQRLAANALGDVLAISGRLGRGSRGDRNQLRLYVVVCLLPSAAAGAASASTASDVTVKMVLSIRASRSGRAPIQPVALLSAAPPAPL